MQLYSHLLLTCTPAKLKLWFASCAGAGCGLPPGPSGLLGAAEGVSYLVVGGVVLWSLATKLSTGRGECHTRVGSSFWTAA